MIKVDCSELSGETKLATAGAISNGLDGKGVALLDGNYVAIDTLSGPDNGTFEECDVAVCVEHSQKIHDLDYDFAVKYRDLPKMLAALLSSGFGLEDALVRTRKKAGRR